MLWIRPLLGLCLLQMGGAFLVQFIPIMAPIFIEDLGWSDDTVGYFAAGLMFGTFTFLLAGMPAIRAFGPIRALQLGVCLGAFGVSLFWLPVWGVHLTASFLIGFAYGPTAPAGGEVLQRYAPARHRSLIFSIRQAAVPLGGALAGLLLPTAVKAVGWRETLAFVIVGMLALAVVTQPVRASVDALRTSVRELSPRLLFSFGNIRRPFAALARVRAIRLALAGGSLAITQGCWNAFLVTYLFTDLGFSVADAGAIFALNQGAAIAGRLLLGWGADRLNASIGVMLATSLAAAVVCVALALAQPGWPFWLIAVVAAFAGLSVSGWNGLLQAELAHRAPRDLVAEVSAGGTIAVALGFIAGPLLFAAMMALLGGGRGAFLAIGLFPVLSLGLFAWERSARQG